MPGVKTSADAFFGPDDHDHAACVADAILRAERICRDRQLRLTPLRRRVLEIVLGSHKPIGAYAVLEELKPRGRAAPPTVYRALEFLLENGLVHRLESLNAYIGCVRPDEPHQGQFLICAVCRDSAELADPAVSRAIQASAAAVGFEIRRQTVENFGICPKCR